MDNKASDMTDWPAVVGRHADSVWRTAYRLLGSHDEAADCFQDTFLAALELSRRQKVRNWSALLKRICTCRALDRLRGKVRYRSSHESLADMSMLAGDNPGPDARAQHAELTDRLREALAELPARQAQVFCLRCLDDMSYRAIARELDMKTSAVGTALHRARNRLRELLTLTLPSNLQEKQTEVSS